MDDSIVLNHKLIYEDTPGGAVPVWSAPGLLEHWRDGEFVGYITLEQAEKIRTTPGKKGCEK